MNAHGSNIARAAILALLASSCSDSTVRVEITVPTFRAKYIEILNKNDLDYSIGEDAVFTVRVNSIGELDARMSEYMDWEANERKK